MRAVIQRVKEASVAVNGQTVGAIGPGLLVFLGIGKDDGQADMEWMADKIIHLRIFEKENGKFDLSLMDTKGEILVVSQFTLYGNCSKGRRPSFSDAMDAGRAKTLFDSFVSRVKSVVERVETGMFQASMNVSLVNDGPVTLILDSRLQ
jgi:D-aminoacyl-tRNA deacylase